MTGRPQDDIMKDIAMFRGESQETFNNLQANMLHMLGHCIKMIGLGCQQQSWPELFALLADKTEGGNDELMEQMRQMHFLFAKYIGWVDGSDPEGVVDAAKDNTFYEALDRVGWRDIPVPARTGYMAMLGLYMTSRIWVLGRQAHNLAAKFPQERPFDVMAQAAGHCLRSYDQGTTTVPTALSLLEEATVFARAAGIKEDQAVRTVMAAYISNRNDMPDAAALTQLSPLRAAKKD